MASWRWIVALALMAAGFAACSSGSGSRPGAAGAAGGTVTTVASNAGPPPTDASLKAQLLTANDLPSGYTTFPESTTSQDTTFCNGAPPARASAEARVSFAKAAAGTLAPPSLLESIRTFRSESVARTEFDKAKQQSAACKSYSNGGQTVIIAALSFPDLGERSFAVSVSGSVAAAVAATVDAVFVQKRNVIVEVIDGGVGPVNVTELEAIAKAAVGKVH